MNINEYIGDVVQCHLCKQQGRRTYHFDVDGRCPECGASLYWQCHPIDGDDLSECAQIALNQTAMRKAKWILEHADQDTRTEIIQYLNIFQNK